MNDAAKPPAAGPLPAAPSPSADPRDVSICIICGGTALARKCKIVCQNCGYTRDCSDP